VAEKKEDGLVNREAGSLTISPKTRLARTVPETSIRRQMPLRQSAKRLARGALEALSAVRPKHWDALRISLSHSRRLLSSSAPALEHLERAMSWLRNAQDATGSGGVSWGYRSRAAIRSTETVGWQPAYPETTGYLIETFLRYGHQKKDPDFLDRARRMADWETGIQLDDGGIPGGTLGAQPVASSTFVTGQVIFGWLRAFQEWEDQKYLQAAGRAADFLVSCLDEEGRFKSGYSHFCGPGPKAYEVRTGWALVLAGRRLGVPRYIDAGRRIAAFTLSCQRPNGWFSQNDLDNHSMPLTHTIGYTLDGLLETGLLLEESSCLEAVSNSLSQLKSLIHEDGFLAGRWTSDWKPAAQWCCLTGSGQLAGVCFRAHRIYPHQGFDAMGKKLLGFVAFTQTLEGSNRGLVGAIHGSYPFGGDYGRYCCLNWAAKFYADAVMDFFAVSEHPRMEAGRTIASPSQFPAA